MCDYLDNILVTGETEEKHLETLNKVLSRLEAGMRLKRTKCTFLLPAVEFGHHISAEGICQTQEKQ